MNKEVIIRLSKYKRLLVKLKALGMDKVYSNNLGDAIGVTPSLVRKDFSMLSFNGNKKGGYEIDSLHKQIRQVLKGDEPQRCIIAGCGRLGSALMDYKEFRQEDIEIIAGFDVDSTKWRTTDIPIFSIDDMPDFIQREQIHVGVISVPDSAATQVLNTMLSAGIRGVLNFSSVELKCSQITAKDACNRCAIHNVNLMLELEHLFFQARHLDDENYFHKNHVSEDKE